MLYKRGSLPISKFLIAIFFLGIFLSCLPVGRFPKFIWATNEKPIEVYLFYSKDCPASAAEINFLVEIIDKYPQIKIKQYETSNLANYDYFQRMSLKYHLSSSSIPAIFIGNKHIVGFESKAKTGKMIEQYFNELIFEQATKAKASNKKNKVFFVILFSFIILIVLTLVFKKRRDKI